jgi:hypothetical protein
MCATELTWGEWWSLLEGIAEDADCPLLDEEPWLGFYYNGVTPEKAWQIVMAVESDKI